MLAIDFDKRKVSSLNIDFIAADRLRGRPVDCQHAFTRLKTNSAGPSLCELGWITLTSAGRQFQKNAAHSFGRLEQAAMTSEFPSASAARWSRARPGPLEIMHKGAMPKATIRGSKAPPRRSKRVRSLGAMQGVTASVYALNPEVNRRASAAYQTANRDPF